MRGLYDVGLKVLVVRCLRLAAKHGVNFCQRHRMHVVLCSQAIFSYALVALGNLDALWRGMVPRAPTSAPPTLVLRIDYPQPLAELIDRTTAVLVCVPSPVLSFNPFSELLRVHHARQKAPHPTHPIPYKPATHNTSARVLSIAYIDGSISFRRFPCVRLCCLLPHNPYSTAVHPPPLP